MDFFILGIIRHGHSPDTNSGTGESIDGLGRRLALGKLLVVSIK